jgi:hypothetical protein
MITEGSHPSTYLFSAQSISATVQAFKGSDERRDEVGLLQELVNFDSIRIAYTSRTRSHCSRAIVADMGHNGSLHIDKEPVRFTAVLPVFTHRDFTSRISHRQWSPPKLMSCVVWGSARESLRT